MGRGLRINVYSDTGSRDNGYILGMFPDLLAQEQLLLLSTVDSVHYPTLFESKRGRFTPWVERVDEACRIKT